MRKKITLRQPDDDAQRQAAADEWVTRETEPPTPTYTETQKPTEKPARLTIDLPHDLHTRFKAACAQHRTKMKDEVLSFIEEWTRKHR
ncbi:MAG: hypothetical protein JO249_10270 [Acidobacteria bacterium]|nr:hypothetical protein [Acidobacteriota bacterium]